MERYNNEELQPIIELLITAGHLIQNIGKTDDIFKIRETNPRLYRLYMDINNCACDAIDLRNK